MSQSNSQIALRTMTPGEIESLGGASDGGLLIYVNGELWGWADEYGTVMHPDRSLSRQTQELAESLAEAAAEILAHEPVWTEKSGSRS